jgi:hypothetical protein
MRVVDSPADGRAGQGRRMPRPFQGRASALWFGAGADDTWLSRHAYRPDGFAGGRAFFGAGSGAAADRTPAPPTPPKPLTCRCSASGDRFLPGKLTGLEQPAQQRRSNGAGPRKTPRLAKRAFCETVHGTFVAAAPVTNGDAPAAGRGRLAAGSPARSAFTSFTSPCNPPFRG